MLLAIDIGNSNVTLGVFDGDRQGPHWRLASDNARTADEYGLQLAGLMAHAGLKPGQLTGACLASVVPPLTAKLVEASRRYLEADPLVVGAGVKTGVRLRTDDPKEVGADRVVNTCAVNALFGGPACVVDFGTAVTFDLVNADGDYLGGAIAPGPQLAAHSLYRYTARLPRVELQRPPSPIGRNTVHAIQAGVMFGYAALVEGMVARYRRELGPEMRVVATGGLAWLVAEETGVIDEVVPWLTLEGLRVIWSLNR